MADRPTKKYDLTDFDADNYWMETQRAIAATYTFPNLAQKSARPAQLGETVGDLLQSAMYFGGIDTMPFTIRDESLVVVACRGNDTVGITVIDPTGDVARDVVTWMEPTQEMWVAYVLKIELLRNARAAGIDRVIVQSGTTAQSIYEALGLRPIGAAP